VAYWRDRFDWRAQEAALNRLPHFQVPIADLDLHFIHAPGVGPNPLPLLISHGWPGSIWEFHRILPLLTDPGRHGGDPRDAFTVVAPSLPGYGFSYRPNQPRQDIAQIADTFATLMADVLGHPRFAAHGGDWGSYVTARLGAAYPERLVGIHLTLMPLRPTFAAPEHPTDEERRFLDEVRRWQREEQGYHMIQGTRPQTLAYALTDSPVGLAAWIVEKFRAWSDCDGDVERRFSKDDLLTNVMLYWVTGAISSSFWPYYAIRHHPWPLPEDRRIDVPTGFASFPKEIRHPPRRVVEQAFNLRRWTEMPAGGHFAALEEPEALAAELRAFFRDLR